MATSSINEWADRLDTYLRSLEDQQPVQVRVDDLGDTTADGYAPKSTFTPAKVA